MSRIEQRTTTQRLLHDAGFPGLLERLDDDMTSVEPAERRVLEILRATVGSPRVLVLEDPWLACRSARVSAIIAVLHKASPPAQSASGVAGRSSGPRATRPCTAGSSMAARRPRRRRRPSPSPSPSPSRSPSPRLRRPPPPRHLRCSTTAGPRPSPPPPTDYATPEAARPLGWGPRGFSVAASRRPGWHARPRYDPRSGLRPDLIRGAGISHLVTLTQETLPGEDLRAHGLINLHFPIVDMDVPSEDAAARLASQIAELRRWPLRRLPLQSRPRPHRNHARLSADLGRRARTAGPDPGSLRRARLDQSDKQVAFLGRFEDWLRRTWPIEQGQRKKRSASTHEHPISLQGAVMTAKEGRPMTSR